MKIYIDGGYYDEKNAKISVFDHGLLYGDGIFEGIRAYHGSVFRLKEHIDRLFYSAKAIMLAIPMSHAEMMKAILDTCRRNKLRDCYIRLVVTREAVMELAAQMGLAVAEPNLTRYDLFNAEECFLTGTGAEIVPVVKIDGRVIGAGKPGPVTKRLVSDYHALTKTSGEPIYG